MLGHCPESVLLLSGNKPTYRWKAFNFYIKGNLKEDRVPKIG